MSSAQLRQGAVYFMQHREVTSAKGHFLIVVSEDPASNKLVILDVVTSKVDRVKERIRLQGLEADTAIELSPAQLGFLSLPSIVNCNDPKFSSLTSFEEDLKMPGAHFVGYLPQDLLDAIIRASIRSPMIKPEHKRQISAAIYKHFCDTQALAAAGKAPQIKITVS